MTNISLQAGLEPFPGYHLRELRGRGGYAEVWEADTPNGRRALKFLSGVDDGAAPREIRAMEAVRKLTHPHLIQIDNVWTYGGYIVICMELAEASLLELLDAYQAEFGNTIVAEQACLLLAQAASALDFLNTRQHHIDGKLTAVRHCDVKPGNLLLFGEVVKLTDFGLATLATAPLQSHRRAGTLDYAAPEVFQGRISEQTDQYALAITYCLIRSGQFPFHDTPRNFERLYQRPVPDLSMLSRPEQPIVARALAAVPQDRWRSCHDFIAELTKVAT
jgi:serine/threonine protein kinase